MSTVGSNETIESCGCIVNHDKQFSSSHHDNKYTFPVLFDEGFVEKYGVEGIPTKFVIDRNGIIQFKKIGSEGEEMLKNLSAQIDLLLSDEFYSM